MKTDLLTLLRCPQNGSRLQFDHKDGIEPDADNIVTGWLVNEDFAFCYPIRGGSPRFVPKSNYADNFGMQWNRFAKTQLDSHSGHPISYDRFWKATGWCPEDLRGTWVLDVGCGAGRFAEVALNAGAKVVALDYSSAVDACYANLRHYSDLHVVQGDLYNLPFEPGSFQFVYSLGVLQHTPDVARALAALPPMLAEGGMLCVDFYEKSFKSLLHPKYLMRPLTTRLPKEELFVILQKLLPLLLKVSRVMGVVPVAGKMLKRLIPVANYEGILPLSENQFHEWALLDTFDWLSPAYDQPQSADTICNWLEKAGLNEIEVLKVGHLVGRGRK